MMRKIVWILFFLCVPYVAYSLNYPSTTPNGEVSGGIFSHFFKNMFTNCPEWQAVTGLYFGGNLLDIRNGSLRCHTLWTVEFIGDMIGQEGFIPRYNSTGKKLILSVLFQENNNIGVGTMSPTARLDVRGNIKIGNALNLCTPASEWEMRYSRTLKKMEFCDGASWQIISTGQDVNLPKTTSSMVCNAQNVWKMSWNVVRKQVWYNCQDRHGSVPCPVSVTLEKFQCIQHGVGGNCPYISFWGMGQLMYCWTPRWLL